MDTESESGALMCQRQLPDPTSSLIYYFLLVIDIAISNNLTISLICDLDAKGKYFMEPVVLWDCLSPLRDVW